MKFLGWLYRKYIKAAKIAASSEDSLCGDELDSVLAIFNSYRYRENALEVVEKITKDEKDYRKCSLCAIVCIAHSISIRAEMEKIV